MATPMLAVTETSEPASRTRARSRCASASASLKSGSIDVSVVGIGLGRFEVGESRTYRFTVLLAKDTPKDELERSAGAIYEWNLAPGIRDEPPEPDVL
jgi:hypothetical protein